MVEPRELAKALLDGLGVDRSKVSVHAYYDEDESHSVDILTAVETPRMGVFTYSTLGLCAAENVVEGEQSPVELLLSGADDEPDIANALSTAAFNVLKDRWEACPGALFNDVLSMYFPEASTPHLVWVEPERFKKLRKVTIGDTSIRWLVGVPVTEEEAQLLENDGFDAFDEVMSESRVDIYDLYRESVV